MLAGLLPSAWWPGAIFQKEMRVQGRRYFTFLSRGLTALLLAGVTGMIFLVMVQSAFLNDTSLTSSGAVRLQELQGLAPAVSVAVFLIQLIGVSLAGPVLLGPSLCDEKRAGTLSALLTTPLTPAQIVLGKLLSAFSELTILALIPLPLVLAVRVFGGVPAEFVFAGIVISFSLAFLGGSLAILYSTGVKRGLTASMLAMMSVIGLHAIPAIVVGKLISMGLKIPLGVPIGMSSPATAAVLIADLVGGGPPVPWGLRAVWMGNAALNVVIGVATLLLAMVRVRALLRREGEGATQVEAGTSKRASKERSASRRVGDHPVLWREVRQRMFRRVFFAVLSILAALTFVLLVNWRDWTSRQPTMIVTALGTILSLLLSGMGSAGSVNGEREARTWDVLMTTGLTPSRIVIGKFVGSLRRQVFMPIVVIAQLMLAIVLGVLHPAALAVHLVIVLPAMAFLSATGLWLSMVFRRATTAAVFNTAIALCLWALLPAIVGVSSLLFEKVGMRVLGENVLRGTFAINPVFMAVSNAEGFMSGGGSRQGHFFALGPGGDLSLGVWVAVAALVTGGVYALATAGVLSGIIARFNRLAGRAS